MSGLIRKSFVRLPGSCHLVGLAGLLWLVRGAGVKGAPRVFEYPSLSIVVTVDAPMYLAERRSGAFEFPNAPFMLGNHAN